MERFLIENNGPFDGPVQYGIDWLVTRGGTIVAPLKDSYYGIFDVDESGFKKIEKEFNASGIILQTGRGGFFVKGMNVLAIYPTPDVLNEMERMGSFESALVISWDVNETSRWKDEYQPEIISID